MSADVTLTEDDGPECETCGKVECPDAALPAFSEPRDCAYAPIYRALRDAKDCDYGCARDYTNQAVRLWVVEAVEQILAARLAAVEDESAVEWIKRLVGAWDCCATCAGGVLAQRDRMHRAAAEAERAALVERVEALAAEYEAALTTPPFVGGRAEREAIAQVIADLRALSGGAR